MGLSGLNAVGTDGEEALSSAFKSVFPFSVHLLCQIHKRENITRKLRSLHVNECDMKQIICDIFGHKNGETILPGLVDSTDASHFLTQLQQLQDSLNSISPDFFGWFSKNEADLMCSSMITSVRTSAGLGNRPKSFTTNNNELLNHLLKQKADYKRNEWPSFNKLLRDLCEQQQHECAKAVFGEGEFELVDAYKHLEVPHSMWIGMSPEQRKQSVDKINKITFGQKIASPSTAMSISTKQLSVKLELRC